MSLLKKLGAILSGGGGPSADAYALHYYVRCHRCGEVIRARADLRNELSAEYGEGQAAGGYVYRKVLVGARRCFQPLEVSMTFDGRRRVLSRQVSGGEFVTQDEYEKAAAGQA